MARMSPTDQSRNNSAAKAVNERVPTMVKTGSNSICQRNERSNAPKSPFEPRPMPTCKTNKASRHVGRA